MYESNKYVNVTNRRDRLHFNVILLVWNTLEETVLYLLYNYKTELQWLYDTVINLNITLHSLRLSIYSMDIKVIYWVILKSQPLYWAGVQVLPGDVHAPTWQDRTEPQCDTESEPSRGILGLLLHQHTLFDLEYDKPPACRMLCQHRDWLVPEHLWEGRDFLK